LSIKIKHPQMGVQDIQDTLRRLGNRVLAEHSQRFFKTGKGQYGEGDKFLGIRVPVIRKLAKKYKGISLKNALKLLKSPYHEERLFALLILVEKFPGAGEEEQGGIYDLYLNNTIHINNWDLVDISAGHIVGAYLADKNKKPLYQLARSNRLWERRIAIISTFYMIKRDKFTDALKVAALLRDDKEDLIHKAVGWMLREIGKRNAAVEKAFLKKHYRQMPRTMLRYAIEKFPEKERQMYLLGKI